jgi:hypothetical protein
LKIKKIQGLIFITRGMLSRGSKNYIVAHLGISSPSLFCGNRKDKRWGIKMGIYLYRFCSPLFLGPFNKMKPIQSEKVAKAMIKTSNGEFKHHVFESNELVELSNY